MRSLICSVLLVFILSATGMSESTQRLSSELKSEIDVLDGSLLAIDYVLKQMELTQQMLLKKNEAEQAVTQKRIDYLENKQAELEADKEALETQLSLLDDSEGLPTVLKTLHETIAKGLQSEINLWRGVAIGSGVVTVAVIVYIIIKGR